MSNIAWEDGDEAAELDTELPQHGKGRRTRRSATHRAAAPATSSRPTFGLSGAGRSAGLIGGTEVTFVSRDDDWAKFS